MDGDASRFFLPAQSRESAHANARTDAALAEIPAPAGHPGRDGHAHRETGVSSLTSPAGAQPCAPAGGFSGIDLTGLARGLTDLSGALLTIARALQQLAPHPATDQGPSVSRGPEAARGESTEAPKRGAEPRPASKPKGQPKPGKWTPARRALIETMRAERKTAPEILAAVNAVPGIDAVASTEAIKSRAEKLKVRRSKAGWRRCRDRANAKMRGIGRAWSDEMVAALHQHYPNKAMRLDEIAAALTAIAGPDAPVTISAVQQKAYELHIPRARGRAPIRQPAAAAAPARASGAPSAPKAATAAPPASPNKIPPAALTNPAREMAVSAGATSSPDTQSSAAAGGAPRPTVQTIIGANGARVTIAAAPQPTGDDEPPPYDPTRKSSVESRVERARDLLRKGTEPHIVVMHTMLQLREVFRLQGEVRRERSAA